MKLHIASELFLWFGLLLFGSFGFFLTVLFPQPVGFYAFIATAALGGLAVSTYVWHTKSQGKHLVCPSGGDCNAVVTSKYSKFFGIKLEYMGMLYFLFIFLSYVGILFVPQFFTGIIRFFVLMATASAFFFSGYLLFVQAFLLKKWCIWCILSSMFSLTIFFIALISVSFAITFLESAYPLFEMLKSFGFVLGMGGATAALFLFVRFLRDESIDDKELGAIKDILELVFAGLAITIMSQFALYVVSPLELIGSSLFIMQMIALFVAAFAAAIFMIIYTPFLSFIPFEKLSKGDRRAAFIALRRPAFILGSLALTSWYFAFAMNFLEEIGLLLLLGAYFIILSLAVIISVIWELQYRGEPNRK